MAIAGGAALIGGSAIYSADRQSSAARSAARTQAAGVENARADNLAATNRARSALDPYGYYSQPQQQVQQDPAISQLGPRPQGGGVAMSVAGRLWDQQAEQIRANTPQAQPVMQGGGQTIPDPRNEYLGGVQQSAAFTNQGYGQSESTLSPLAALAQPYLDEQYNLLGMGGNQAYQQALGRVSDPLVAEQERALMRNSAALGGVGGNELAALAEMTRNRTEANIGNRLGQLSSASSPALSALQQISNLRLNRGLNMADIFGGAGRDLSTMETNRRQSLANLELGQGSELAQLSQNLGNAQSGYAAYRANNAPALAQGITSGIGAYMGMGGTFGTPRPQQQMSPLAPIAQQQPYMGNQAGQINLPRY